MAVIIKNMDMPENCYQCRFCNSLGEDDAWVCDCFLAFIPDPRNGKLNTCPLDEVKDYFQGGFLCKDCSCEAYDMKLNLPPCIAKLRGK